MTPCTFDAPLDSYGRVATATLRRLYERVRDIRPGHQLHHRCENKACSNLEHVAQMPGWEHEAWHRATNRPPLHALA